MSENAQITAEIERILDERKAVATANLKMVVIGGSLFYVGYKLTRRLMRMPVKRHYQASDLQSV